MLHIRLERLRMLHIRDRWFSPQATKIGVRFAQKSHKSFQIKQISSAQRAEAIITVHQVTYQIEKTEVCRLLMLNNEHETCRRPTDRRGVPNHTNQKR